MLVTDSVETVDHVVSRFFSIDSITRGEHDHQGVLVRYMGHLYASDSAAAYDQLSTQLKPFKITPLFRKVGGQQSIWLVPERAAPRASNPWINVILYVLTVLSVLTAGYSATTGDPSFINALTHLWVGWPYAVSLMAILTAHEFGHYLVGRFHKVHLTLPYFIPLPYLSIGTMGAVINLKEQPRNRRILLDIGIAGPLAGLIVAIPVLLIGLSLSNLSVINPSPQGFSTLMEGNSILYLLAKFAVFHRFLPEPASFGGLPPFLYWIRYFFTAQPQPLGALDVSLHPVAWAGWVGILVTALNLIPAGQLDGGHLIYVLFGSQTARRLYPFILIALGVLGFVWNGWWLWFFLIFIFGRALDDPLDQITPLNPARRVLAVIGLIVFLLVFTPVPMSLV